MPVANDPVLGRLADGITVVTATERLARELRRQFDRRQLDLGKQAWESADVLPYHACLRRLWQNLGARPGHCPALLNAPQLVAAWENLIRDDINRREHAAAPLWNPHASAKTAVDAWRVLNAWNIDLDACAHSAHEDHRRWLRWARQFQRLCADRNWLDPHRLASALTALLGDAGAGGQLPEKIEFAGFDRILPQQRSLIEALQNAGVEVAVAAPAEAGGRAVELRDYEDEAAQWLSAAHWARGKLLDDPQARIAIIAPNLDKAAPAIEYALKQILCPQQLVEPGTGATLPYHLSLGQPLIRYPLAQAAVDALAPLAGQPLAGDAISRLLRSPFIRGADTEADARGQLDAWLRRRLPYQIRFEQLLRELPAADRPGQAPRGPHCPRLGALLNAVAPLLQGIDQPKSAGHWARRFSEWLSQLGWPGERALDSDEFQTMRAFQEQLRNLALLDLTTAPMNAATALSWLRRRLGEQPFQVESRGAPVQVLGVLEAAGQRFDAIWFGNLVEADWPPAQRPNPFIAARLQREAGVIESALEHNREHAALLQRRLLASGDEIVLTRPRTDDGIPAEPSPLLAPLGAPSAGVDSNPAADRPFDTPATITHAHKPELLAFTDPRGPAFAQGAAAKGGVAVLENQAKCPFRAFAVHRLGAREIEQNEQGLAASERGSLIHRALQLAWRALESSQKLAGMDDGELQAVIRDAAEQAGRRHRFSSGCGDRFQQTQTQWVCATLSEWFDIEKQRARAFTAGPLEQEIGLNLAGLELAFKIDRIDHMEGGALALIDYKTGNVDSLQNWLGARPQSPQLPLYAIAQENAVEALAYGRVKRGNCGFTGVTNGVEFDRDGGQSNRMPPLADSRSLRQAFDDWDALLEHWRTALPQLAAEFLAGEARVDPLNPGVCTRCDLHGFCRIDAQPNGAEDAS